MNRFANATRCCADDGASLFHVMDTLSAYYLNQPPPLSPTFEHFFTTPPECPRSQLSDSLPHLLRIVMDYPPNQILQKFGLRMMSTERLVLRFTKDQLSKLKDRATRESGNKTWSSMDSLGGYLATLQNRFDEEPVREIHYILGVSFVSSDWFHFMTSFVSLVSWSEGCSREQLHGPALNLAGKRSHDNSNKAYSS